LRESSLANFHQTRCACKFKLRQRTAPKKAGNANILDICRENQKFQHRKTKAARANLSQPGIPGENSDFECNATPERAIPEHLNTSRNSDGAKTAFVVNEVLKSNGPQDAFASQLNRIDSVGLKARRIHGFKWKGNRDGRTHRKISNERARNSINQEIADHRKSGIPCFDFNHERSQ
jgi:hypothetical protein